MASENLGWFVLEATIKRQEDELQRLRAENANLKVSLAVQSGARLDAEDARDALQADTGRSVFGGIKLQHLRIENGELAASVEELERQKDAAYLERNQCVATLSKCFPAVRARTAIEGWSEDWHGCVYITLPTGQVSWHYHDSQAYLFEHLPRGEAKWDGHDTPEKYRRLAAIDSAIEEAKK